YFHFLLNKVAQLKQRCLENEQALLELRREDLLQCKILRLVYSRSAHAPSLPAQHTWSKQRPIGSPVDGFSFYGFPLTIIQLISPSNTTISPNRSRSLLRGMAIRSARNPGAIRPSVFC